MRRQSNRLETASGGTGSFLTRGAVVGSFLAVALLACSVSASADEQTEHFFESYVRPILVERCISCHGQARQEGGLRLDSKSAMSTGGDSGPAVVPQSADSLILHAVRRVGDLAMPPDQPLAAEQVEILEEWVGMGAPWPSHSPTLPNSTNANPTDHWAFQPVANPAIPTLAASVQTQNPIDAFILSRLVEQDIVPATEADRRTLIRRLSYTLTGLPPSHEEVERFVHDQSDESYGKLVDRYLASQQYGEHWARHWLDVARYSDTKGYVYAREERFWVHAWRYRDWVTQSLNEDMPYDRFLLLQLAADQTKDKRHEDLAAMGFLTIGRRFLGVNRDIMDDRIDVVTRGMLGLTVGCARCHDHKYDPIPTADYYSLFGVFNSCSESLVRLDREPRDAAFEAELDKRLSALAKRLKSSREESAGRARSRIRDYLYAQTELQKYPPNGFDQVFEESDLLPTFVRRWETYLRDAKRDKDPVFMPWHMFAELAEESFTLQAPAVCEAILRAGPGDIHPRVAAMFESPPANFIEVIDRYAQLLTLVASEAETEVEEQQESSKQSTREPAALQLREVMFGPKSPCSVPDEGIVHTETYFDTNTCTALWKLQGEVDRWLIGPELPQGDAEQPQGHADWPPGYALILEDRPTPCTPRIFLRGNILTQGDEVPRRFLQILSLTDRKPFANGSGRLELAESITDHNNPLTARVIVNRVWTQHFGSGLVTTPSDFGLRSQPPSHPKLLDWLTSWFIDHGWSLKELHKLVVTSAAFRRSSLGPADTAELARALQVDPDNRLLWRMNPRRLTFEQFRDSMLASTGELKLQTGGKPADLFDVSNSRRTLYGLVDRQFFPAVLRVFDSANPDLHVAKRNQTIVPQQALFFLNHPLVLQRARQLSAVCSDEADMNRAVVRMFGRVLQREPTEDELQDALQILGQSSGEAPTLRLTAADWTYGYGEYQDARQQVESFHQLPHFTGQSWQGGVKWPDNKLGWVQLTATGGHPGNTRATACVRRWTAPRDMTVRVDSNLRHEVAAGDGVRAFVVGSRAGLLASAKVHQSSATLNVDTIQVSRGDTIEFIVDIDRILNSDQFLWKATITELESQSATVWDSEADFPIDYVEKLGPLDQLAQILFCSNEFLFVD